MASISNTIAITCCDAAVDALDVGSADANGDLLIYSAGSGVPANADTAITDQVLLAQLELSNPAAGAAADINPGARSTFNAITSDSAADASGTAAFARLRNRDNVAKIQMSVGTSGAEIIFNAVAFTAGAAVAISALTLTQPEA